MAVFELDSLLNYNPTELLILYNFRPAILHRI